VVATPGVMPNRWIKRHGWLLAAALALTVLLVLAIRSPDRQTSLGTLEAGGPMRHIAVDAVRTVRVQQGTRTLVLQRTLDAWTRDGGAALAEAPAVRLRSALRLLHNTPPERHFDTELAEFGLASAKLRVEVAVDDGTALALSFGASNPIGLARYVRVSAGPEAGVVLLPGDVHDSWLAVLNDEAR
jgi:hypothetical protein